MSPSEGFKIAVLREAAGHAPTVLPGQLGATAREWLIGEANCQEGSKEGAESLANLVDSVAGEPVADRATIQMFVSTLDAAYDFAAAIISCAAILAARADSSEATR